MSYRERLSPAPPPSPGETISRLLTERGGNRAWLSVLSGISRRRVQALAEDATPLTPDDARRLASVLPLSASEWLELDRNYRSSVTRLA